ncbi:hypothetical protein JNW90_26585 [Micromonospora sp. STR1s_5]|nr:hypothetical protein [Micromonospora sp. STR1s_5]
MVLIFALGAPVLATIVAAAVDYASAASLKARLQLVADNAALAGVSELDPNSSSTERAAKSRAAAVASSAAPAATQIVDASTAERSVTVSLSVQKRLFFGGLLTPGILPVSVTATGVRGRTAAPCMLALGPNEPVGIELVGSSSISAPKCLVQANTAQQGITTQGAPNVSALKVCVSGEIGSAKTNAPAEKCAPASDPYNNRQLRAGNLTSPLSKYTGPCDLTDKHIANNTKVTVSLLPGVYCGGLTIQSSDVVLAPGLYTMQDGPLAIQGSGSLTGTGVSILLAGSDAVLDLQGSAKINLEAMQTGPLAGIVIAADTSSSPVLVSKLQGSVDLTVKGSLYLPKQRIEMQGSPGLKITGASDSLIAQSYKLQGNPDITLASDSSSMNGSPGDIRIAR